MYRRSDNLWIVLMAAFIFAACGGGGGADSPPNPVTESTGITIDTLRFTNTNFSEVEIKNSFAFIVQFGDHFDVEVEIDRQYSHLVSVVQDGVRLSIRFDPAFTGDIRAQVARGVVTLPLLNALQVDGSAFVDMAGFEQSYLQTYQSGSSHVVGTDNRIDFVDAVLSGSSHLDLQDSAPLPAANAALSGNSQATLRVMGGGTLTGSVAGSSNLSYFGASVSVMVQTDDTATVTWLGDNGG